MVDVERIQANDSKRDGNFVQSEVSLKYLFRIMRVLSEYRRIGISDLALLTRINHQRCVLNIEWLEKLGFVEVTTTNNRKQVIVTEGGADFIAKLLSMFEPFELLQNTTPMAAAKMQRL